jgi:hypothetical protein
VSLDRSRRQFLQAGLALPAAGIISSTDLDPASQEPPKVAYRTLGKTGLKVSGVVRICPPSGRSLLPVAFLSWLAAHLKYVLLPRHYFAPRA